MNQIELFWQEFLKTAGLDKKTRYYESCHFCNDENSANELLKLVLSGQKKATSSSLAAYELAGENLPATGSYSIVTNWAGEPECVIETVKTTIIPFDDVTYELCQKEGEDDNLESWRNNHIKFFSEEGRQLGYTFSGEMKILFEEFQVVYSK